MTDRRHHEENQNPSPRRVPSAPASARRRPPPSRQSIASPNRASSSSSSSSSSSFRFSRPQQQQPRMIRRGGGTDDEEESVGSGSDLMDRRRGTPTPPPAVIAPHAASSSTSGLLFADLPGSQSCRRRGGRERARGGEGGGSPASRHRDESEGEEEGDYYDDEHSQRRKGRGKGGRDVEYSEEEGEEEEEEEEEEGGEHEDAGASSTEEQGAAKQHKRRRRRERRIKPEQQQEEELPPPPPVNPLPRHLYDPTSDRMTPADALLMRQQSASPSASLGVGGGGGGRREGGGVGVGQRGMLAMEELATRRRHEGMKEGGEGGGDRRRGGVSGSRDGGRGGVRERREGPTRKGGWGSQIRCNLKLAEKARDAHRLTQFMTHNVELIEDRASRGTDERNQMVREGTMNVIESCLRILEGDNEHFVVPIVHTLRRLGAVRQTFVSSALDHHFADVVDVLIGWTFEPTLTDAARLAIEEAIQAWGSGPNPYWDRQLAFACTLLKSFLKDIDSLLASITHDLNLKKQQEATPSMSRKDLSLSPLPQQQSLPAAAGAEPRLRSFCGLFVIILGCLPPSAFEKGSPINESSQIYGPSPFPPLVLKFLNIICKTLAPVSTTGPDWDTGLPLFLSRCLSKVVDALASLASPPSSSASSTTNLKNVQEQLLVPAYYLGASLCLGGGIMSSPPSSENWPLDWLNLGLSTHLTLLTRLWPTPSPSTSSSTNSTSASSPTTSTSSTSGASAAAAATVPSMDQLSLRCLIGWPRGSKEMIIYTTSSSAVRPKLRSWLAEWRLLPQASSSSSTSELQALLLRTYTELAKRSNGEELYNLIVNEVQALLPLAMSLKDSQEEKGWAIWDLAGLPSCGQRRELTGQQAKRAVAMDILVIGAILADTGVSSSSSSIPTTKKDVGSGAEKEKPLMQQQQHERGRKAATLILKSLIKSKAKLEEGEGSNEITKAAVELAGRLIRFLGGGEGEEGEFVPTIIESLLVLGLNASASTTSTSTGAATSPPRALQIIDEALGRALWWPELRHILSSSSVLTLLGDAVASLSSSPSPVRRQAVADEETTASSGEARRGLALSLLLKMVRLLHGSHHHHEQGEADALWSASSRIKKLAWSISSNGLKDPSPRLRSPAMQLLALLYLLRGPSSSSSMEEEDEVEGEETLGHVLFLQTRPEGILSSPFQQDPNHVRRLLDLLMGQSQQHPQSIASNLRGGGGGAVADDEGSWQWLRSLCLDAAVQAIEQIEAAKGATGDAAVREEQAQKLLEGCLEGGRESDGIEHANALGQEAYQCLGVAQRWGIWELARILVWSRLKTHMGGANATFAALERALVKSKLELLGGGGGGAGGSGQGGGGGAAMNPAMLRRGTALLAFFAALERHIANAAQGSLATDAACLYLEALRGPEGPATQLPSAAEGSTDESSSKKEDSEALPPQAPAFLSIEPHALPPIRVLLPPPSKKTETFFRANRRVCEDWLGRVRPLLTDLALALGAHHEALRHGLTRLIDMARPLFLPPATPSTSQFSATTPKASAGTQQQQQQQQQQQAKKAQQQEQQQQQQHLRRSPSSSSTSSSSPTAAAGAAAASASSAKDLRKLASDVEEVAVGLASAMLAMGDAQGLYGLERWLESLPRPGPPSGIGWLQASGLMAKGRYEEALGRWTAEFFLLEQQSQQSSSSSSGGGDRRDHDRKRGGQAEEKKMTPQALAQARATADRLRRKAGTPAVLRLIVDRSLACYCKLGDWRGLSHWLRALRGLHSALSALALAPTSALDDSTSEKEEGGEKEMQDSSSGSAEASSSRSSLSREPVPSWMVYGLEPRADPYLVQAGMRIDARSWTIMAMAVPHQTEEGRGKEEKEADAAGSSQIPPPPKPARRPNLSSRDLSDCLSLLHGPGVGGSGGALLPQGSSWSMVGAQEAEKALLYSLDETLGLLIDRANKTHEDRLRALETQTPRLLEALAMLPSGSAAMTLASKSCLPSSVLLTDSACMGSLASTLRQEGGGGVAGSSSSKRPPSALHGLIEDVAEQKAAILLLPSLSAVNVEGNEARTWLQLNRTASTIHALERLLHPPPASPSGVDHAFSSPPAAAAVLSRSEILLKCSWFRTARRQGNLRLSRDLMQQLDWLIKAGGMSNSTEIPPIDPALRCMIRYEEAQVLALESIGNAAHHHQQRSYHHLGPALASLLSTASSLLLVSQDNHTSSVAAAAPWLEEAQQQQGGGEDLGSLFNQEDRHQRKYWTYRCLARAAKWLLQIPQSSSSTSFNSIQCEGTPAWLSSLMADSGEADLLAGRCLELAAALTPSGRQGAKAWRLWGDWAYRRAKALLTPSSATTSSSALTTWERSNFVTSELEALVEDLASREASRDPTLAFKEALLALLTRSTYDDVMKVEEVLTSQALERIACEGGGSSPEALREAREIVSHVQKRRKEERGRSFEAAMRAYCQYLKLGEGEAKRMQGEEATTLSLAALRLIKMIARENIMKMDEASTQVIDSLLASTPLSRWRSVAPQLLARLAALPRDDAGGGKGEAAAVKVLHPLAERIVLAYPQEMGWAVVVGRAEAEAKVGKLTPSPSSTSGTEGDDEGERGDSATTTVGGEGDVPSSAAASTRATPLLAAKERWGALETALSQTHADLLAELRSFLHQVTSLSYLWDERWLHLVGERWHSRGLQSRLINLTREGTRLARNRTLSEEEKGRIASERYAAVLLPLALEAESLANETIRQTPSTPHEEAFVLKWKERIEFTLVLLRIAPDSTAAMAPITHVWPVFDTLRSEMNKAVANRGYRLHVTQVAPGLEALTTAKGGLRHLSMPGYGQETFYLPHQQGGDAVVRIIGAANNVEVLRTKTKPKRLALLGSDGREYGYLLKSREDLRLDQRLMQLLAATNRLLSTSSSASASKGGRLSLRARHYAVIPLSSNAGLVQWIDSTIPLFSLYKAWRIRTARGEKLVAAQQAMMMAQQPPQAQPPPPPAPPVEAEKKRRRRGGRRRRGEGRNEKGKEQEEVYHDDPESFPALGASSAPPSSSSTAEEGGDAAAVAAEKEVQEEEEKKKQEEEEEERRRKKGEEQKRRKEEGEEEEGEEERAPAAMFYGELVPALAEKGIAASSSREDWPKDVLRKVYDRLVSKSPRSLIEQEILAGSYGADDLWARRRRLAGSLAVMSMIGAVLGLGDRHLNNILLDPRRAEVLHIDYNVCFDRGAKLRVPEVVPFRMTPSLVRAIGPLGTCDGVFRTAAEMTLKALRRHRELFLSILEALALDPAVDWAEMLGLAGGGGGAGEEQKAQTEAVEARVTLKLFALRVGEVRGLLEDRVNRIENGLKALSTLVARVKEIRASTAAVGDGSKEVVVDAAELAKERALLAGRLGQIEVRRESLWKLVDKADKARGPLDQALMASLMNLRKQWEAQVMAGEKVLGIVVGGEEGGEGGGLFAEALTQFLRQKVRKAISSGGGGGGGGGSTNSSGKDSSGLNPQYCYLTEGLHLLPTPVGEEEASQYTALVQACKAEEARAGLYLSRLSIALGPVLDLFTTYWTIICQDLGLDPATYLRKSLVKQWLNVLEGQSSRVQSLEKLISLSSREAAKDVADPSEWSMFEEGSEVDLTRIRQIPLDERMRWTKEEAARVLELQELWKAAVQEREALETRTVGGEGERIAQQEAQAIASFDEAKARLKATLRLIFKASNLSPPDLGVGGKRHLLTQQAAQQGMHRFCLDVIDQLDGLWLRARGFGDDEASSSTEAVMNEMQSLVIGLEILACEVILPGLGRVEEMEGLSEKIGKIRLTFQALAKVVTSSLSQEEVSSLVASLEGQAAEDDQRNNRLYELAEEAQLLLGEWKGKRENVLCLLSKQSEQAVREGSSLSTSGSDDKGGGGGGRRRSISSSASTSSSSAVVDRDGEVWKGRVQSLREEWQEEEEGKSGDVCLKSSSSCRHPLAFVKHLFDRLEATELPPPSSTTTSRDPVGVTGQEPWCGGSFEVSYLLTLERIITGARLVDACQAATSTTRISSSGRNNSDASPITATSSSGGRNSDASPDTTSSIKYGLQALMVTSLLASAVGRVFEEAIAGPLGLFTRSLVDRIIRVLSSSAPHLLLVEEGGGGRGLEGNKLEGGEEEQSPKRRWSDRIQSFASTSEAAALVDHETGKEALAQVFEAAQLVEEARTASLALASRIDKAKAKEVALLEQIRQFEWEHEGDLRLLLSSQQQQQQQPPFTYTYLTPSTQSRAYVLESVASAMNRLAQVTVETDGQLLGQQWRLMIEDLASRATAGGLTGAKAVHSWEVKAKQHGVGLLEKGGEGAKLALKVAEAILDVEKARPDMIGILPEAEVREKTLMDLMTRHETAMAISANHRRAWMTCWMEGEEVKGRKERVEKEAAEWEKRVDEVGRKKKVWREEEMRRKGQVMEAMRLLAEGLRDRSTSTLSSTEQQQQDVEGKSGGGGRIMDVGLIGALAKATMRGASTCSALTDLHEHAQSLLKEVQEVERKTSALAVLLEGCVIEGSMQEGGRKGEGGKGEQWDTALESLVEVLEGLGGEESLVGIGEDVRDCFEELEILAEEADAVAAAGGVGVGGGGENAVAATAADEGGADQGEAEGEGGGGVQVIGSSTTSRAISSMVTIPHPLPAALSAIHRVKARIEGRGSTSSSSTTTSFSVSGISIRTTKEKEDFSISSSIAADASSNSSSSNGPLSIKEQIDQWIQEATSPDRLAVMFEGWAAFI